MLRFHFPIVIIDEDFRSENTSGLGIRALAAGDREGGHGGAGRHQLRRPVAVRAAAKPRQRVHPVDRRRGVHARPRARPGGAQPAQVHRARSASSNAEIPIYLYGETRTSQHIPNDILRELHGFIHMFEDTPEFVARHIIREAQQLPRRRWRRRSSARWSTTRRTARTRGTARATRGGVAFLKSPVGPDVPPVLRREHAARRRLQLGRRARPAARPHRPGGRQRAQRGAHLQRRPLLLRHQRHQHQQQDGLAPHGGAGRRGGGRPQLPQVDPARDHHDRRDPGVPDADAQPPTASSARSRTSEFEPESDPRKIAANPLLAGNGAARSQAAHPDASRRAPTTACSTTSRPIKHACSTATSTRCTSTRPGCRTPPSTSSTRRMHAIGKDRPRAEGRRWSSPRSPRTSCWPASAQASQMLVQDSQTRKLDRHLFNEAYLMHTSTVAAVRDHRVAATSRRR